MDLRKIFSLSLTISLAACSDAGQQAPVDGSERRDGMSADASLLDGNNELAISLALPEPQIFVARGMSTSVVVDITHANTTRSIALSVLGLPTGVTVPSIVVAPDATQATLVFSAAANAPLSATPVLISLDARAVGASAGNQLAADLIVRGRAGDLDVTFNNSGRRSIDVSGMGAREVVAVLPSREFFLLLDQHLVRFNSVGGNDATLGAIPSGFGTTLIAAPPANVIVAVDNVASMYARTGALVTGYGSNGSAQLPYTSGMFRFANSKLYLTGENNPHLGSFAELSATGIPRAITGSNLFPTYSYHDYRVASDGRITVCATSDTNIAIARITANGSKDAGFGSNGQVLLANQLNPTSSFNVCRLGLQADGSGYAVVTFIAGNTSKVMLLKFSAQGVLASERPVIAALHPESIATHIEMQRNGAILVAGTDAGSPFLARFLPTLAPDTNFGNNGRVALSHAPNDLHVFDEGRAMSTTFEFSGEGSFVHVERVWL